jgi:PAS domain S-box-containing protein
MIVRSISDAVLVLDLDQRIVEANPAATALLASPTPRLIGRPVQELFAEVAALLTRSPSSHEVYEEITAKRGQTIRRLEIRSSPLRSQWGQARGRVVIVRDISEQKRAEEQATQLALEQAKVRMMSEFIDNASHDLNTPLTTLRISTDLLKVYTTRLPKPINTLRTLLRDTAADETLAQLEKLVQSVLINGERAWSARCWRWCGWTSNCSSSQRLVRSTMWLARSSKKLNSGPWRNS